MNKIFKHYPMTDRLIVRREYFIFQYIKFWKCVRASLCCTCTIVGQCCDLIVGQCRDLIVGQCRDLYYMATLTQAMHWT